MPTLPHTSNNPAAAFTSAELRILWRLNTPRRIQDFLETLDHNPRDTLRSPRGVLRERKAHCIEGALLAAAALWLQGERPLLLDVRSTSDDLDHVVTVFQRRGYWGAFSKTRYAVLRYREPVYRTVRELAMSFFHEYFLDDGRKTMRDYSVPFDVARRFGLSWLTSEEDLWDVGEALDASRHQSVLTPAQRRELRLADPIERKAGKLVILEK